VVLYCIRPDLIGGQSLEETGLLLSSTGYPPPRFENSTAYLASRVKKFESDPRMIVSAASQAQRSADFVLGIEPKESLQKCQVSPEGMPLTWVREHEIDTRIASFAHRNPGGEGASTLTEWKQATKPSERLSCPLQPGLGL